MSGANALHFEIRDYFLKLVRDGTLRCGDQVSDYQIAKNLGVSRTPVRSVLSTLEQEGMLSKVNRGWRLASIKAQNTQSKTDLVSKLLADRARGLLSESVFESDLMKRYETSRAEVKRTLERLAADGLVERRRGNGWRFIEALASLEALQESYVFREMLECAALEHRDWRDNAAEREALTKEHRAILGQDPDDLDPVHWFETNRRFHEYIASGVSNGFVSRAMAQQNRLRRLWEFAEFSSLTEARIAQSCEDHLAVMKAIAEGDTAFAAALLRRHLRTSSKS